MLFFETQCILLAVYDMTVIFIYYVVVFAGTDADAGSCA